MPNTWIMGLELSPMDRMRSGVKTGEFRLDKEKWRGIEPGDRIEFQRIGEHETVLESLLVDVLEVVRRPNFQELFDYVYANSWGEEGRSPKEHCMSLERRYSKKDRRKHPGVVGFRIKLAPLPRGTV